MADAAATDQPKMTPFKSVFPLVLAALAFASSGRAEDAVLTSLETGDDAAGWEAVGKLNIAGRGFCTGALIAPDLVLTAAHCLYDHDSGERVPDDSIEFLAGWRNGQALAYRQVKQAVAHPDYLHAGEPQGENSRFDIALLKLDQPIRSTQITPFAIGSHDDLGADVAVVSYAFDRADVPSLQQVCGVLGEQDGVIVMTCDVDFGSSGAPIFAIRDWQPEILSVVSAKADLDGAPVAIGVLLDGPLALLESSLAAQIGLFLDGAPGAVRVIAGGERAETGAKFVRP
jgi:protease YdgD